MLTPKLSEVMRAVEAIVARGSEPTLGAVVKETGRSSKGAMSSAMGRLVERGFLSRDPRGRVSIRRTVAEALAGDPVSDDPLVLWILERQRAHHGVCPDFRAIMSHLGTVSHSMTMRRLRSLVDRGDIAWDAAGGRAANRGIVVVMRPAGSIDPTGEEKA